MKPELEEHLVSLYPWVKPVKSQTDHPFRFECGDGWYHLLMELFREIEEAHKNDLHGQILKVGYVKEKFGALKVGMGYIKSPEIQQIVKKYEELSRIVCEGCSNDHILRWIGGWATTKCDDCVESELKRLKEKRRGSELDQ